MHSPHKSDKSNNVLAQTEHIAEKRRNTTTCDVHMSDVGGLGRPRGCTLGEWVNDGLCLFCCCLALLGRKKVNLLKSANDFSAKCTL